MSPSSSVSANINIGSFGYTGIEPIQQDLNMSIQMIWGLKGSDFTWIVLNIVPDVSGTPIGRTASLGTQTSIFILVLEGIKVKRKVGTEPPFNKNIEKI